MKLKYEIISKKNLYKGFFESNELKLKFRKHDGSWSPVIKREVFGGAHVSTLLPYDPKKQEIILIQQFRAGVISRYDDDYLYEIVAGIIENFQTNDGIKIPKALIPYTGFDIID